MTQIPPTTPSAAADAHTEPILTHEKSLANKIASVDRFVLASLGDYDWRPGLRDVQAPALVVHGEADPIPVASALEWASALPNARRSSVQARKITVD